MADTPDGQGPPPRRPSLRGSLMIDTVHGKVRIRAWPRKRGKPKTPDQAHRQTKFAMAQLASKFVSPQQMVDVMNARAGTPILPRDVFTSLFYGRLAAFIMTNGKVIWPMAARTDVSDALDVITQTPGYFLRRGNAGWEGVAQPSSLGFRLIQDEMITAPTPAWISDDLTGLSILFILGTQLTASASTTRTFGVSMDHGLNWLQSTGDYTAWQEDGVIANGSSIGGTSVASAAARNCALAVIGLDSSRPSLALNVQRFTAYTIAGQNAPITNIRVQPRSGTTPTGNLTGGRITIWGM